MRTSFQIQSEEESGTKPVNILDMLDTMIAPKVDSSVTVNGIRENVFSCKKFAQTGSQSYAAAKLKKRSTCAGCAPQTTNNCQNTEHSCSNPDFTLSGRKCFYVSNLSDAEMTNFTSANSECEDLGASSQPTTPL